MFLYLVTCLLRVTVSVLCRSQGPTVSSPFTNSIGINCNMCIFDTQCEGHSNKTVTHRKHVTKYKNKLKWMVKFLRKSASRGGRIALVNSIRTKYINLLQFCVVLGSVVIEEDFPCTVHREVYADIFVIAHLTFAFTRELWRKYHFLY